LRGLRLLVVVRVVRSVLRLILELAVLRVLVVSAVRLALVVSVVLVGAWFLLAGRVVVLRV
jgi:hypothetical protein